DKNIFNKDVVRKLNIMSIRESNTISESFIDNISNEDIKEQAKYLIEQFKDAKEIGSLLILNNNDYSILEKYINDDNTIFGIELREKIIPLIQLSNILSKKYDVVVTNPPYINSNFMSKNLKDYIVDRYKDVKYDLFSAFIVRNNQFSKENGNLGFMTPYVWMFISSYEKLRRYLIDNACITSLIQFEYSAFEEATVPICTFTLKKTDKLKKGIYFRLVDYKGGMKVQEKMFFEEKENQKYYIREVDEFNRVPGSPIVYWLSNNMFNAFQIGQPLYKMGDTRQGMATSDVNRFTRFWYEVNDSQIGFNYNSLDGTKNGVHKWFPYIKGGKFRKWSGNNGTLVNWQFDGKEVKDYAAKLYKSYTRTIKNIGYYLRECISWGMITSSDISVRYYDSGYIFDIAGCCLFAEHKNLIYLLAFLNTKIARELTKAINPTINMNVGDIANLPIIYEEKYNSQIEKIIEENISISKREWDSFETSWDFKKHPLINM
ncbi:MAG: N-6 DNA methylase, partial [Bacilli bacterium]